MKRKMLPVLLCLCLLLTGCGGHEREKRFVSFSQALSEAAQLRFTAELKLNLGGEPLSFTLAYQRDAEGQRVEILKPERVAGVKAHVAPGSSTLEFEGLILDLGPLDPYGLSPMNALPTLVEALCAGHLDSHWEEDGDLACRLIVDDHRAATVWFRSEEMVPLRAELQSGEKLNITCEIQDWHTE